METKESQCSFLRREWKVNMANADKVWNLEKVYERKLFKDIIVRKQEGMK